MNSILKTIKWRYIVTAVIITLSIIAAVLVRVKGVEQFQDKYLSGYDSYFYYRQAKTIIAEGGLPDRDYMQNYPDGLDLRGRANLNCYAIAYFYNCTQIFAKETVTARASMSGGKFNASVEDAFRPPEDQVVLRIHLWRPFLIAALFLLLVDIVLRRVDLRRG